MNTTHIKTDAETNTLTALCANGNALTYSPKTDGRVVECIDSKMFTTTEQAAEELASELQAYGCREARALGFAVVFWG